MHVDGNFCETECFNVHDHMLCTSSRLPCFALRIPVRMDVYVILMLGSVHVVEVAINNASFA